MSIFSSNSARSSGGKHQAARRIDTGSASSSTAPSFLLHPSLSSVVYTLTSPSLHPVLLYSCSSLSCLQFLILYLLFPFSASTIHPVSSGIPFLLRPPFHVLDFDRDSLRRQRLQSSLRPSFPTWFGRLRVRRRRSRGRPVFVDGSLGQRHPSARGELHAELLRHLHVVAGVDVVENTAAGQLHLRK